VAEEGPHRPVAPAAAQGRHREGAALAALEAEVAAAADKAQAWALAQRKCTLEEAVANVLVPVAGKGA